jgi:hypothetical protein
MIALSGYLGLGFTVYIGTETVCFGIEKSGRYSQGNKRVKSFRLILVQMVEVIIEIETEIVNGSPEIKITHGIGVGTLISGKVTPGKKELALVKMIVVEIG